MKQRLCHAVSAHPHQHGGEHQAMHIRHEANTNVKVEGDRHAAAAERAVMRATKEC